MTDQIVAEGDHLVAQGRAAMTDLTQVDEGDLRRELDRRATIRWQQERDRRAARDRWLLDHVPSLLGLVPEHTALGCSDRHTNPHGECLRCVLLRAEQSDWWDEDFDVAISLVVRPPVDTRSTA